MPGENAFLGRVVQEQVEFALQIGSRKLRLQIMPRISATKPQMLSEFEERFRRILKRIYRSLQQHEIRDEVSVYGKSIVSKLCIPDHRRAQAHYVAVAGIRFVCQESSNYVPPPCGTSELLSVPPHKK